MNERRIAWLVGSVSSLVFWDLLSKIGILSGKVTTGLVVLSLIPFIFTSFKLLNDFKLESSYFKFIFTIFICYEFVIVIRGWSFSYYYLKVFLQSDYVLWPLLIPLFVFFDKKIVNFGYIFKWIYNSGLFFLVFVLIFPSLFIKRLTAETYISLFVPCGFILLNATYLKDKKVNFAFFLIFISIVSLTYLARRSGLVTLLGFVVASYFLNVLNKSGSRLFRYFPLVFIIGVMVLFSSYFENSKEVLLNKMTSRISEDTRTGLFDMFFYDLKDRMVFGNGMNGSYYYPLSGEIDGVVFGEVEYRNIIENGYLQLLLTGGILHIVLFVLVMVPAAFKGIFQSSNQLAKACGVIIFLRLVDMFLYGLPTLSLTYILAWIAVGVCYKESIRRMTNDEIRDEFNKMELI